jgi:hypothetical protein
LDKEWEMVFEIAKKEEAKETPTGDKDNLNLRLSGSSSSISAPTASCDPFWQQLCKLGKARIRNNITLTVLKRYIFQWQNPQRK